VIFIAFGDIKVSTAINEDAQLNFPIAQEEAAQ
jgi:hypothetical protein